MRKPSTELDSLRNRLRPATYPMVASKYIKVCDDTDLVTNLVTKAKRPHEVGVCYKPRRLGYWLRGQLWVMSVQT